MMQIFLQSMLLRASSSSSSHQHRRRRQLRLRNREQVKEVMMVMIGEILSRSNEKGKGGVILISAKGGGKGGRTAMNCMITIGD